MVQPEGGIEEQAGLGRVLWSNRRRILASTAALGLAAFLAGTLVPPIHRVSIKIAAGADLAARWTGPAVEDMLRDLATEPSRDPSGIFAAWVQVIEAASDAEPDRGVERLSDGSLVAWAEDGDEEDARRRAERLADRLVAGSETVGANAAVANPSGAPVPSLVQSVERARDALAAAQTRVAEAETALPSSGSDDAARQQVLATDRRAVEALRQTLRRTERLARDLPTASPDEAPPAIRERQEWLDWRDALSRRDKVAAQVADLSRTLRLNRKFSCSTTPS